jgi:DNA polymerase-4
VRTVGELAELTSGTVIGALGDANGRHLHELAHGIDPRPVVPEQPLKSVGHEETFPEDHHERAGLDLEAVRMADAVASRLRAHGLAGRTVTIKVRFHDFRTITRATTLPAPVDSGSVIARAAKTLLTGVDPSPGVRLFGVSVSGLSTDAGRQLTLDEIDPDAGGGASREEADHAVDEIRRRFGDDAIGPAVLAGPGGLRRKHRGDQQWGPESSRC